ncbi:MAG TPA: hypothetical protein VE935_06680 [Burkholderiales bacterium]|jgi:Spy/CpxP family protein refolding chaperone|nr:hypothetical protein [Burkholderiales bacterium]
MKLPVFTILTAALLAGSSALYAQSPEGGKPPAGKAQARRFDCSKAKDPKGCEERVAKLREAREKAEKACEGKTGAERRECMEKAFCAEAKDPAKCEATLKERAAQREKIRAACKDKKGDDLKACIREQRAANKK